MNSEAGMKNMKKKMNEAEEQNSPTARIEDIREPYWEDGHWVFERTPTTPSGRDQTTSRVYFATTNPQDCDPFCSYYFKKHGVVCCHRYSLIQRKNEYKTFSNMCEMEQYNCRQLTKRPHWHPLYRGACVTLYKMHSGPSWSIVDRKRQFDPS
ncbi:uncharacterized protein LOC111354680 [Spodoptera litura]|uniref:Uncharacterized protein LOC111354680 n=1 Tax=Spodoptera litura TaxID=69820 RepID=A0A9J7E445_SPOLT|nr:uncharacterized protein LOC111354680 [Spodoptera litura]